MDGENNGKPYFLMDDLGGKPTIFGNTHKDPMVLWFSIFHPWRFVVWRIHNLDRRLDFRCFEEGV